jgi:hypothetical protein
VIPCTEAQGALQPARLSLIRLADPAKG